MKVISFFKVYGPVDPVMEARREERAMWNIGCTMADPFDCVMQEGSVEVRQIKTETVSVPWVPLSLIERMIPLLRAEYTRRLAASAEPRPYYDFIGDREQCTAAERMWAERWAAHQEFSRQFEQEHTVMLQSSRGRKKTWESGVKVVAAENWVAPMIKPEHQWKVVQFLMDEDYTPPPFAQWL